MKNSCIQAPTRNTKVVICEWQLNLCEGDAATAALLSLFEYSHNSKLDQIEERERTKEYLNKIGQTTHLPEVSLYQFYTESQLIERILSVAKSPTKVRKCIKFLEKKGIVSIHQNPFVSRDRTRFFLFHPEVVNAWIAEHYPPEPTSKPPQNTPAQRLNAQLDHVPYVENENVTKTNEPEQKEQAESKICPSCGSNMVQRKNLVGSLFWGCSNYPNCNHTENIKIKKLKPDRPKTVKGIPRLVVRLYTKSGEFIKSDFLLETEVKKLVPYNKTGLPDCYLIPD